MNRKQRRAAKAVARKAKRRPQQQVAHVNIAQLKGQIQSLEAEQVRAERAIASATQTFHETTGALKLARHQLAQMERAAHIAAEAEKAKAEAAEQTKDAPVLDTNHC